MKKCLYCAEEIQDEAVKCKHCGSVLPDAGLEPEPFGFSAPPSNRLLRPSRGKMVAGFARYLGIDAVWVRILYAVATVFFAVFPGVILYVILSMIIPSDDQVRAS